MLQIFSDAFKTAARVDDHSQPISQEERHRRFLVKQRQERRALEQERDRAFYRRW